jgi:hypothetical protein
MPTDLHREIQVPPYVVIADAQEEWRPRPLQVNVLEGYRASAVISRLDGSQISGSAAAYPLGLGDLFGTPQAALSDCEQRARDAIKEGFPG